MNKKLKRSVSAALVCTMILTAAALSSCGGNNNTPAAQTASAAAGTEAAVTTTADAPKTTTDTAALETTENTAGSDEETTAEDANDASLKQALENLDSVISVETIEPGEDATYFSERYLVTFEQPLDWNDPSKGTFPQRVVVDINDEAEINVMETNGYCLNDYVFPASIIGTTNVFGLDYLMGKNLIPEMTGLVTKGGNYINVEHRFFGGSRPADMSNTDTRYWEYHTPENAAKDLHHIYTALAPLLCDRWVAVGTSRSGLITNVYAYYFPEDMNVYISYVAPCSDGLNSESMYRFVYEEIGDLTYGEEAAKNYRGIVTDFQVELMKKKEVLLPVFINFIEKTGSLYQNDMGDYGQLYDLTVLEFAVQVWQYKPKQNFDDLKAIIDMPEDTEESITQKLDSLLLTFLNTQNPQDFSYNYAAWPYFVNTAIYYGQYLYDFSYLRQALEAAGVENTLSVSPEQDKDIPWSIVFTPEQREAFVYDSGVFHDELLDDMKTTEAKHLMIFGGTDPWRSQAVPEEVTDGNENIRRYINPDYPHDGTISNMPDEMKNEVIELLGDWLDI